MLVDDGTSGDQHFGDTVFSYRGTVSPTAALGPRHGRRFTYAFDYGLRISRLRGLRSGFVSGWIRRASRRGVSEYRATVAAETVQSTPTFNRFCELPRSLSHKPRVANSLCRKLAKATHAKSARQRRHQLREYRAEVRAHTGWKRSKAFRPPDGARLQALARQLERV